MNGSSTMRMFPSRSAHSTEGARCAAAAIPTLVSAARQHSQEMAADGYFAHSSANGTAFWRRIQGFYGSRNWGPWAVGENLAWAAPGGTASSAAARWKRSPEHRKTLLTARWREIGISAVHVPAAPGVFHGLGVTIITTDFGVRR